MNGEWRLVQEYPGLYPFAGWQWFVNGEATPHGIEWPKGATPPHISTLKFENPYRNPPGSGNHISSL